MEDDAIGTKQADVIILDHHTRSVSEQVGGVDGSHDMTGVEDDAAGLPSDHRSLAIDHDAVDLVFRRLHPDGTDRTDIINPAEGLIAYKGAPDHHTAGIRGDDKMACLITQPAADERGIGRTEQGKACIGHGLTLFVRDPSYQTTARLVGTLHKVFIVVSDNTDGPEAYNLHQCLFKIQTLEVASDGEILQIVIDEGYLMAGGDGIEVFEHTAKGFALITACDLLAISHADHSAQQQQNQ